MNKDEIIKKLQELPNDLPIVFYRYNDSVTNIGDKIENIEVVKAYKCYGRYQKYDHDYNRKDKLFDVIWIS